MAAGIFRRVGLAHPGGGGAQVGVFLIGQLHGAVILIGIMVGAALQAVARPNAGHVDQAHCEANDQRQNDLILGEGLMPGREPLAGDHIVAVLPLGDARPDVLPHDGDHLGRALGVSARRQIAGHLVDGIFDPRVGHVVDHRAGSGQVMIAVVHVDVVQNAAFFFIQPEAALIVVFIRDLLGAALVAFVGRDDDEIHARFFLKGLDLLLQLLNLRGGKQFRPVEDPVAVRQRGACPQAGQDQQQGKNPLINSSHRSLPP